ncbi:DUF1178 family protein [Martelella endophytica]|uniref:Uncharacterized protein n=1 Tax=Martelella endophytica TaxID=1486262 RepID=A0A0D5LRI2_MAREN|nr:DUF1178 family protein [Martelella endophytica]AJY45938.1 hypothetical protein TM49_10095 [Martelella endophytica]
MIHYSLSCDNGHAFDGWFSGSADFDSQVQRGLLTCPVCGSASVSKGLMAPPVSTARKQEQRQAALVDRAQREAVEKLRKAVAEIRSNAEDVGERFPEEARRIHYGEAEERGIIGEANLDDVRDLLEEGIEIMPLPVLPDDKN